MKLFGKKPRWNWREEGQAVKKGRPAILSRAGWFCLGTFVLITLATIFGPYLTPHSHEEQNTRLGATAPLSRLYSISEDRPKHPELAVNRLRSLMANNPMRERGDIRQAVQALDRGETIAKVYLRVPILIRTRQGDFIPPFLVDPGEADAAQSELLLHIDPEHLRRHDPETLFSEELWIINRVGRSHLLGTDELGRDLLTRVLVGGRLSIGVGVAATLVALIIGVCYGAVSGYAGGKVDALMMRMVDTLYALPFLILVIILMVVFDRSLLLLFLAIGAIEWLTMARIVRGQVLHLKHQPFVDALRVLGASPARILFLHLIPNCLGPILVVATLTVPAVMLFESVLSFLGLGVQPPMSSWGLLIKEGAERMETFPWMLIFPSLAFIITLLSLNFLGDELRDRFSPKSGQS